MYHWIFRFVIHFYKAQKSDLWLNQVNTDCSWLQSQPGARPTNDISIEFEIRPKFAVLWFKIYSTDPNDILHTSWQCNCRDVSKISLWSVKHILN